MTRKCLVLYSVQIISNALILTAILKGIFNPHLTDKTLKLREGDLNHLTQRESHNLSLLLILLPLNLPVWPVEPPYPTALLSHNHPQQDHIRFI